MDFILGDRATGKTTALIPWVNEQVGRVILVHNLQEADRLSRAYDLYPEQVMTAQSLTREGSGPPRGRKRVYALDNLDLILGHLLGNQNIAIVTASVGPNVHPDGGTKLTVLETPEQRRKRPRVTL